MNNKNLGNDPVSNLIEILFTRKFVIFIGFISVFSVIVLAALAMNAEYEAHAKLLISNPTLPTRTDVPYMSEFRSREFLANQREIIGSRLILEKVARRLRLWETKKPKSLKIKIKEMIYRWFNLKIAKIDPIEDSINQLYESIKISTIKRTNIIIISARTNNPKKAALYANTIADTYIGYANSLLSTKTKKASQFIEKQLEKAKQRLDESENKLHIFQQKDLTMPPDDKRAKIDQKIDELKEKYENLQLEITRIKSLNGNNAKNNINIAIADDDRAKLLEEINSLNSQLSAALGQYTDLHPEVIRIRNRIKKCEEELNNMQHTKPSDMNEANKSKIDQMLISYKIQKTYMEKQLAKLYAKRKRMTETEIEFSKLTQDYIKATKEYALLSARLENTEMLDEYKIVGDGIKIIDYAFAPALPDNKTKKIIIIVGFVASIIFGLSIALVTEYLDDSIKNIQDVEEKIGFKVIGTVPVITRKMQKNC